MDVEAEQMNKYPFVLQSYNLYDPHCLVKDHYMRVQFNWVHGACHWAEEDAWRCCYNSSRLNEPFNFTVEWLAKQHEPTYQRAPEVATTVEVKIPVRDKGKRKIFDRMEEKKSYKFQADSLVEKASMPIEEKRQQCDKRNTKRQREKWRMEET